MPLANRSPTKARIDEASRMPIGERPSRVSMKWAQNRSPNMITEVQMNSHFPCSEVNRLPVMF